MSFLYSVDPRSYTLPVVVTVVAHLLLLVILSVSWTSETEVVNVPSHIKARVIQEQPKAIKPKPVSRPKTIKPKPKPKSNPKPKETKSQTVPVEKTKTPIVKEESEALVKEQTPLPEIDVSEMEADFAEALEEDQARRAERDEQAANDFVSQIRAEISRVWSYPPSARRDMATTVRIFTVPTGEVTQVSVTLSSGNEALDRSVVQAVKKASPLSVPKDIQLYERSFRSLSITFRPEDARY